MDQSTVWSVDRTFKTVLSFFFFFHQLFTIHVLIQLDDQTVSLTIYMLITNENKYTFKSYIGIFFCNYLSSKYYICRQIYYKLRFWCWKLRTANWINGLEKYQEDEKFANNQNILLVFEVSKYLENCFQTTKNTVECTVNLHY